MTSIADWIAERLKAAVASQGALFSNAGLMALGVLMSSALGFVYWWVAARAFPAEDVGLASAAISILSLCALAGEFGLGTLLIGEIPRLKEKSRGLISAALLASMGLSALCGFGFMTLTQSLAPQSPMAHYGVVVSTLFVIGTSVNGVIIALDQVLIGELRGHLQMYRNVTFAVLKLAMLGVVALLPLKTGQDGAIVATWVLGMSASLLVLVTGGRDGGFRRLFHKPDWPMLLRRTQSFVDHHVLNIVSQAPGLILPFMVATLISPRANAAFFAAWMLVGLALLMPASVTTVLFTVGRKEPAALPDRVRTTLSLSIVYGVAASLAFMLLANLLLSAFNPDYPKLAGPSLRILGLTVIATSVKFHFIAISRLQDRMRAGAVALGIAGAVELAMCAAGARGGGLLGLSIALTLAEFLLAGLMLGPVLEVARPSPARRRAEVRRQLVSQRIDRFVHGSREMAGRKAS